MLLQLLSRVLGLGPRERRLRLHWCYVAFLERLFSTGLLEKPGVALVEPVHDVSDFLV